VIVCLVLVFSSQITQDYLLRKKIVHYQKEILTIQGEKPLETNFDSYPNTIVKNKKLLGGKALEVHSSKKVEGGYFATYTFNIKEDGNYRIYMGGTTPGSVGKDSPWHSPITFILDGKETFLSEEILKKRWPNLTDFNYVFGGYFFFKLTNTELHQGPHTITVRVEKTRAADDFYTYFIDAFIIVKEDFEPDFDVGKIPKELFYV